mgnify:CR=1 FL=1
MKELRVKQSEKALQQSIASDSMPIADYVAQERARETEKQLQWRIVKELQEEGYQVLVFAPPGSHGALGGSLPSNLPDLLVKDAWTVPIWLEVKTPRGVLRKEQHQMHQLLHYYGWRVAVVRSPEEALAAVVGDEIKVEVR